MRLLYPLALMLGSCATPQDLVNDLYPEAQAELRAAVEAIRRDAMNGDIEGLKAAHLNSEKFTKFGPRTFDRQDVSNANNSEAAFFGSIRNLDYRIEDLKIDVFGAIGIATYYPHVSFSKEGETTEASGRQTLVFLKTANGWKLVHEHGTPRRDDDQ
jgi:ketosteroid isomerase-like protein